MSFEPIRSTRRMGQWNRWDVFVHVPKINHSQRRHTRHFHRGNVMLAKPRMHRLIGSVYAESHKDAIHLARQAIAGTALDRIRVTKIAKLTARPLTAAEYQRWLEEVGHGSLHPRFGPLVDSGGSPVACFVPR